MIFAILDSWITIRIDQESITWCFFLFFSDLIGDSAAPPMHPSCTATEREYLSKYDEYCPTGTQDFGFNREQAHTIIVGTFWISNLSNRVWSHYKLKFNQLGNLNLCCKFQTITFKSLMPPLVLEMCQYRATNASNNVLKKQTKLSIQVPMLLLSSKCRSQSLLEALDWREKAR